MRRLAFMLAAVSVIAVSTVFIGFSKQSYIEKKSEELELHKLKARVTAFVNVNVVPMNQEVILKNQTVIVENGFIKVIGSKDAVKVPQGALIIEGEGKYLMPGLIDMHVHLAFSTNDLLLYVANGVTSIRNMAGYTGPGLNPLLQVNNHLELKERILAGKLLGPDIFSAGQILESKKGPSFVKPLYVAVDTAEQAEKAVKETKEKDFDFVKVYNKIPLDAFKAVLASAKENHIRVVGHVPHAANLEEVLREKQLYTIEHLNGYMNPFGGFKIPENKVVEYARLTSEAGVWNCPTIVVWQNILPQNKLDSSDKNIYMKYTSPLARKKWRSNIESFNKKIAAGFEGYERTPSEHIGDYMLLTKELHEAGAGILLGTDSGTLNVIPGYSIHQELENLVRAGLTPYEAIRAGTIDAALCLEKLEKLGTVEVNKQADLVLLEANPLDSVKNIDMRLGVMVNGVWLPQETLDDMLVELALTYR